MPEFTVHLMGTSYRELRIVADTPERAREIAGSGDNPFDLAPGERLVDVDFYSTDEQVQTVESYEGTGDHFKVHTHYSRIDEEMSRG